MIATLKSLSVSIVLGLASCGAGSLAASAQDATLQITVQNGRFQPAELHAPANKGFTIVVKNNDAKPVEFESVSLRVEKVIAAKGQGSVRIRALAPGRYEFLDDFNQSNRGAIIVD